MEWRGGYNDFVSHFNCFIRFSSRENNDPISRNLFVAGIFRSLFFLIKFGDDRWMLVGESLNNNLIIQCFLKHRTINYL